MKPFPNQYQHTIFILLNFFQGKLTYLPMGFGVQCWPLTKGPFSLGTGMSLI